MKLDKFVVDRRVKLMEAEGVRFLTNTEIGKHVSAEFLLKVSHLRINMWSCFWSESILNAVS